MAKLFSFAFLATALVSSTFAHEGHSESSEATPTKECAANVTAAAIATIDNSTHLDTCAPGSTWNLTSLFGAANLSATDFAMFCNATACMNGMHALLDTLPEDCLSNYHGSEVVLADKVDAVHDKCHMDLDEETTSSSSEPVTTAGSKNSSNNATSANSSSTVPTPAPTKSSASDLAISSTSLAALISATATVTTLML